MLGVNLWGVIHAVKAFVPRMIEGGDEGHVVVTSSMAGLACAAFSGPYQTSKFGAYAVAESLAHDLRASGIPIGVSALCPGAVNTRIAGSTRNRPEALPAKGGDDVDFVEGALADLTSHQGIDPSEVAAPGRRRRAGRRLPHPHQRRLRRPAPGPHRCPDRPPAPPDGRLQLNPTRTLCTTAPEVAGGCTR